MLFYIGSFLLLLGPLVFVHEFGHFIFAKLFNVRVDTFSMGFGPKIFRRKWGETEYCLSIVPLGGYVKLFGQDPTETVTPELKNRSLNSQEAWKRFLIFFAGPLFNFIFAVFVFALMLVLGEPHIGPVIARVTPGTQAAVAGFHSGDVITSVNRNVITNFDDVSRIIDESPNKELSFRVKRQGVQKVVKVVPRPAPGLSIYGESIEIGVIDGLSPIGRAAVVGVSDPESIAAKAGLKTGDQIVGLNSISVKSFEDLLPMVQKAIQKSKKELTFHVVPYDLQKWVNERTVSKNMKESKEYKLPARSLESLGIYSSELFIASTVKDSPAEKAGLQPGDRLVSINGKNLIAFEQLREAVKEAGENGAALKVIAEREGERIPLELTPIAHEIDAEQNIKQFMIGVVPLFVQAEPELFIERIFNPFKLTSEAWYRAIDLSFKTLISIKKLFLRQVSMSSLGGPILIGKLAGDSMSRGYAAFLRVMAIISISLAIFNILPIPILDGGHIFLLLIEVLRGKPISMRQTEFVQQIGLSLIVLLLVVVLFNDISRVGLPALRQMLQ